MKLVTCSIFWCLTLLVDAKQGEIRIDESEDYWNNQSIKEALNNKDRSSWLYYRTYSSSTNDAKHICVYANVKGSKSNGSVFEFEQKYVISGNPQEVKEDTLFATTYKSDPQTYKTRPYDNVMRVSKVKGSQKGRRYQLIYSDYKRCDILRVLDSTYGHDCELYLHDSAVDGGVPGGCKSIYGHACGKDDARFQQQVYDNSCREKLGVTTQAPTTPEETSTIPTEKKPEEESTTPTPLPGC
uniref:Putative lipocalin-2 1 n=1 Tax=Ixodes ricinus TaxID=34613 RepID=V5H3W0_IXORI